MGFLTNFFKNKADEAQHRSMTGLWDERLSAANQDYKEWENIYQPDVLMQYYKGQQAEFDEDKPRSVHKQPRTVNLYFPTVELIKPSLFFPGVRMRVAPRPSRIDDALSMVQERAKLQEHTLNTFIADKEFGFEEAVEMALFESMFRFGVVQAAYTADFVQNPRAGEPVMRSDIEDLQPGEQDSQASDGDKVLLEPEKVPENEKLYVSWIPAKSFRAPAASKPKTMDNDFFAFYAWHRAVDIRQNKRFHESRKDIDGSHTSNKDTYFEETLDPDESRRGKMVRVWTVWDLKTMVQHIQVDGHKYVLAVEEFKDLPFSDLRFHITPDSWYPVPETFNWLASQQELNETRAQQTEYRERMLPKWIGDRQMFDTNAQNAIENREIGAIILSDSFRADGLIPLQLPGQNSQMFRSADEAKIDMREISGVTGEQRGIPSAKTATQAQILDLRARAREDFRRLIVGRHISRIGQLTLSMLIEKMSADFWIKVNVDMLSQGAAAEALKTLATWQQIRADALGPMAYDVSVDVASLSPVSEAQAQQQWGQVLTLLSQPNILAMLGTSEILVRKTMEIFGITSEREIVEIHKVARILAERAQLAQPGSQPAPQGRGGVETVQGNLADQQQQLVNAAGLQEVVNG
jgi:hypothetical protein